MPPPPDEARPQPETETEDRKTTPYDSPASTRAAWPVSVPPDAAALTDASSIPAIVPGYEIEGVLGRGGMGVVYRARHLALKRTVALKMILAGAHAGSQELARFRVEAEAVARLQHPNIVQVFEVGDSQGLPYCALEFVEGGSLAGKLRGRPLPVREATCCWLPTAPPR
jgi:serine/threonine-protein kinase